MKIDKEIKMKGFFTKAELHKAIVQECIEQIKKGTSKLQVIKEDHTTMKAQSIPEFHKFWKCHLPGVPVMLCDTMLRIGKLSVDVMSLDTYLQNMCQQPMQKGESMSSCIKRVYGNEAKKWVLDNI